MKRRHISRDVILAFFLVLLAVLSSHRMGAATFSGGASIRVDDPQNALTSTNGIFTVSFWFKLAVPSSHALDEHMTLVMDRSSWNESDAGQYYSNL